MYMPNATRYIQRKLIQKDACVHPAVDSSTAPNSQGTEATWMSASSCLGKDLVHMHDGIFAIKENEVPFVATWMDPEMIIPSEVSQTGQDKYHMISLIRRV